MLLDSYSVTDGFVVTDHGNMPAGAMADGSYNVLFQGRGSQRIWKGIDVLGTGARSMFKTTGGWSGLVDYSTTQGIGSIFNYIANSLFFIGDGRVYQNGTVLADSDTAAPFTASSNLQLSPSPYHHAYTAGLAQPDAPQVEARTASISDTTGLMTGLYSFKIARVRSLTGGRSIASPTSAVIQFAGQTARLTFPLADSNGQDRWAVFATKAGFGGTGVHYEIQEVAESDLTTIDGIARSYEFNVVDADLLPVTAFIDDYPPPAGSFAGRIENYIVVIGAYDNAIASSIRNFPESFNPDHLAFLPKAPTAVLEDQMGSYMYISCESSVHVLSVAPTTGNPMILQTIWTDTGVANNHNWCAVEGILYAFTSRQGAVTMDANGRPTNIFALDVAKKMKDWDVEDVCVFSIPDLNSVAFTHLGEALLYNTQNGKWSSPCKLSDFATGTVVSGVIINRRLQICLKNGSTFTLYQFDEQPTGGTTHFKIVSPDKNHNPVARFNVTGIQATFNAPNTGSYTTSIALNYGGASKTITHSATVGVQDTILSRWYLPRAKAARIEWAGTQSNFSNDCSLISVQTFGTPEASNEL